MSINVDSNWQAPSDPQFQKALTAFQTGDWPQAVPLLEELARQHPGEARIARMLTDARFKANMEGTMHVREKRWIVPWRGILLRVLMIGAVVALLALGASLIQVRVLPVLNNVQEQRRETQLLNSAQQALAEGDFDTATTYFKRLLDLAPGHPEALAGLETIATQRALLERYNAALAAEKRDDEATALATYADLQIDAPGYRDVSVRINSLRKRQELAKLYAQAGTLQKLGLEPEAMNALRQIQEMDINYRRSEVSQQLFALNFKQGQRILEQEPPMPRWLCSLTIRRR
jgi:tetratricopeptide (TPR) repeat protein